MTGRTLLAGMAAWAMLLSGCAAGPDEPFHEEEEAEMKMQLTAGEARFDVILEDSPTVRALAELLPLTVDMVELNGNEKYVDLPRSLPTDARRPGAIRAGDVMLFGSDCLVVFYDTFSSGYAYTPIGRIEDADGLADALGAGHVRVTWAE